VRDVSATSFYPMASTIYARKVSEFVLPRNSTDQRTRNVAIYVHFMGFCNTRLSVPFQWVIEERERSVSFQ
jgi:hypothetical protein